MAGTDGTRKTRANGARRGVSGSRDATGDGVLAKSRAAKLASAQPSGRDEVVGAILATARTLFAERGPAAVSLREIAREAHVNFGLVYQYVGTRDQLVAEVLRRTAADNATRLAETKDFDEAVRMLLSMGNGTTARILAWAILEGHDVTELVGLSPALTILADRARQDAGRVVSEEDAQFLAAMAMVLAVGWRLLGPAALAAAGLDTSRHQPYGDRVAEFVRLLGGTAELQGPGQLGPAAARTNR